MSNLNFNQLPSDWANALADAINTPSYAALWQFLAAQDSGGKIIFPPINRLFTAFHKTPLKQLRVVILGQDPYHGAGQAEGLSFSVPHGVATPPSLQNIYKELVAENLIVMPNHGHLGKWAEQGVFLLNATLTVEASNAGSHQKQGWEVFTDHVIQTVSEQCDAVVFLLWGAYAQKKQLLINARKHLILTSAHPSPLSAYRGFLGNQHFIKTNEFLVSRGLPPINWQP